MATDTSRLIVNIKVNSKKANDSIKKTTQQMGKFRLSTKGVRRSLGAIRNNLLLVTFAFAGVIASIKRVVETSAKFEAVKTRLVGLTGSVKAAEKAFNTFNKVAATTPFSLEDVVEAGAQLKAFGSDAEKLIKPITNLAAFMGTTATEAANAFGRAFAGGAGAADILREKGILNIIKTSRGLTDLAKTTLPEFREALIHTLQDPVVGIEGSTDRLSKTFGGAMSNMKDAATRLSARIGDDLLPVMKELVQKTKEFLDSLDADDIKEFGTTIAGLTIAYVGYKTAVTLAKLETEKFQATLIRTGWGAAIVGIGIIIGDLIRIPLTLSKAREEAQNLKDAMSLEDQIKSLKEQISLEQRATQDLIIKKKMMGFLTDGEETLLSFGKKRSFQLRVDLMLLEAQSREVETVKRKVGEIIDLSKDQKALKEIAKANQEIYKDNIDFQLSAIDGQAEHFRQMKLDEVAITEWTEQAKTDVVSKHLEERNALYGSFMSGYDTFVNSLTDMEMSGAERTKKVWEATKAGFVQILGEMLKEKIKALIVQQTVTKASTVAALATNKVTATALASQYAIPASLAATASFGTAAEVGLAGIMASIAATKGVAAFAKGGDFITSGPQMIMVGDNPGGRERVRVDPLSSGASGDSVSNQTVVHIHGGIVDPDYINNTLIPAINSAGERVA